MSHPDHPSCNAPPFWFVWNPSNRPPSFKHTTASGAMDEAERLARENPGQTFIVLESVMAYRIDALQRIDMRPPEQPF